MAPDELRGDCEAVGDVLYQPVNAASSLAYILAAIVLAVAIHRGSGLGRAAWVYVVSLGLVGATSADFHGPRTAAAELLHDLMIVILLGAAALIPAVRRSRGAAPLPGSTPSRIAAAASLLGLGLAAWLLGRTGSALCAPESIFQWHGLWHLLSAAALGVWGLLLFAGPPSAPRRPTAAGGAAAERRP